MSHQDCKQQLPLAKSVLKWWSDLMSNSDASIPLPSPCYSKHNPQEAAPLGNAFTAQTLGPMPEIMHLLPHFSKASADSHPCVWVALVWMNARHLTRSRDTPVLRTAHLSPLQTWLKFRSLPFLQQQDTSGHNNVRMTESPFFLSTEAVGGMLN